MPHFDMGISEVDIQCWMSLERTFEFSEKGERIVQTSLGVYCCLLTGSGTDEATVGRDLIFG